MAQTETQREWYAANRERLKARSNDYASRNRDRVREWGRARYARKKEQLRARRYGLSLEQLREITAPGRCEVCGGTDDLHIDHDHATGDVRGLLCRGCNTGIGGLQDSPTLLRAAADYLGREPRVRANRDSSPEGRDSEVC